MSEPNALPERWQRLITEFRDNVDRAPEPARGPFVRWTVFLLVPLLLLLMYAAALGFAVNSGTP